MFLLKIALIRIRSWILLRRFYYRISRNQQWRIEKMVMIRLNNKKEREEQEEEEVEEE